MFVCIGLMYLNKITRMLQLISIAFKIYTGNIWHTEIPWFSFPYGSLFLLQP